MLGAAGVMGSGLPPEEPAPDVLRRRDSSGPDDNLSVKSELSVDMWVVELQLSGEQIRLITCQLEVVVVPVGLLVATATAATSAIAFGARGAKQRSNP